MHPAFVTADFSNRWTGHAIVRCDAFFCAGIFADFANIRLSEFFCVVGLAPVLARTLHLVGHIVFLGSKIKVVRIYARRIIALVQNKFLKFDRHVVVKREGQSVRVHIFHRPAKGRRTITVRRNITGPNNAAISKLARLFLKPLGGVKPQTFLAHCITAFTSANHGCAP